MSDRVARAAGSVLIAAATAVVLVALAIVPFLNPVWVAFEQGRAQAAEWTGYTPAQLRSATDAILADLVVGPPDFDAEVDGQPVLTAAERAHMRDVRTVFGGFAVLALGSAVILVAGHRLARGGRPFWGAVRRGVVAVVAGVVVVGVVGLLAFDAAFELFHQLFFAGGNFTFDPRTDRLVQLFPQRFWFETSIVVGAVILVLAGATGWAATRRLRSSTVAPVVRPSWEAAR